jgi:hypothetical protein
VVGNHRLNDVPLGIGQVGRVRLSSFDGCFHCFSSVKGGSGNDFQNARE